MKTVASKPESKPHPSPAVPMEDVERLREDLEMIAYVASHDLLAPVRLMAANGETLKEKVGSSDDPETKRALRELGEETEHLRTLLMGLQEYVRLETFVFKHVPIESGEVVSAAIDTLQEEINAAGAAITYGDLPKVMGHRGRLTRLFAQLIENAVKFRSKAPPRVHISAQRSGDLWQFCVEDNGMGIEEELQESIFRLYQRLHADGAYPGYGIGLALAKKIAASHGSALWVKSAPNQGSHFYFTLPPAD